MSKSFGAFVRYRRQRLGLTQRQLADKLGLKSAAFLSDIESGNRKPSPSLFPAMARVLETEVRDLQACDTRHLLAEVRQLLETRPENAAGFGRILEVIRALGSDEVLHRLEGWSTTASTTPGNTPSRTARTTPRSTAARTAKTPPTTDSLGL